MSIRDSLKKLLTRKPDVSAKTANDNDRATPLDLRETKCPNCQKVLDKIPSRKTKCPYCGEYVYVRTRPKDRARIVVTKAGADKIEAEWESKHDFDLFVARDPSRKDKFEKERESLERTFGKEPSNRDVMWGILNQELGDHFQRRNYGLYRCTRFDMAEILRKKDRQLEPALKTYLGPSPPVS